MCHLLTNKKEDLYRAKLYEAIQRARAVPEADATALTMHDARSFYEIAPDSKHILEIEQTKAKLQEYVDSECQILQERAALLKTREVCRKCHRSDKITIRSVQKRSMDEGATSAYCCHRCNLRWSKNS